MDASNTAACTARCRQRLSLLLLLAVMLQAEKGAFCTSAAMHPELLFVFEYDGLLDWQRVCFDDFATSGAVDWLLQLQDRLTQSHEEPFGNALMVSDPHVL